MLPFENMVAEYVKETGNHVLYRVTLIFEGDDFLASGVLMEAESVEDKGNGILFCVYVYNVQPGITIDYASGKSYLDDDIQLAQKEMEQPELKSIQEPEPTPSSEPQIQVEVQPEENLDFFEISDNIFNCQGTYRKRVLIELRF